MSRSSSFLLAFLACAGGLVVIGGSAVGDDVAAIKGVWAKKSGEAKLDFSDANVLRIAPHGNPEMLAVVCEYSLEKDGLVKAKVTGFEGEAEIKKAVEGHLPIGTKFSFKWDATGGAAKLEKVECSEFDGLKSHLEGDYESAKSE